MNIYISDRYVQKPRYKIYRFTNLDRKQNGTGNKVFDEQTKKETREMQRTREICDVIFLELKSLIHLARQNVLISLDCYMSRLRVFT